MKLEFTASAQRDRKRLKKHQRQFDDAFIGFVAAAEAFRNSGTPFPGKFRVTAVEAARGVFEFTWSFAGPDGRTTFEWDVVVVDRGKKPPTREPLLRIRRIGDHGVFANP